MEHMRKSGGQLVKVFASLILPRGGGSYATILADILSGVFPDIPINQHKSAVQMK